jgi:hypothetical protein
MGMTKDEIISKIYHDPAGYGSIQETLKEARVIDKSITLEDVKKWKEQNLHRTKQLRGYNSYIASEPKFEYQIDPFYVNLEGQKFSKGVLAVDIFTKHVEVIPVMDLTKDSILSALHEIFNKMGKPKMIYTDEDTAIGAPSVQQWFEEQGIKHITTRTHASQAERQIRTFKDMLYKRMEHDGGDDWTKYIYPILLTMNQKRKSTTTGMTPNDASKPENKLHVKLQLEMHRVTTRKYPDIHVGDKVRIYGKKNKLDKERVPVWSHETYKVKNITGKVFGQSYYELEGYHKPMLRHEILLS